MAQRTPQPVFTELFVYDPAIDKWDLTQPPLPVGRTHAAFAVVSDVLYVTAGRKYYERHTEAAGWLNTTFAYDPPLTKTPDNILVTPEGTPKIVDFDSATCFRAEPITGEGAGEQHDRHDHAEVHLVPRVRLAGGGRQRRDGQRRNGQQQHTVYERGQDLEPMIAVVHRLRRIAFDR